MKIVLRILIPYLFGFFFSNSSANPILLCANLIDESAKIFQTVISQYTSIGSLGAISNNFKLILGTTADWLEFKTNVVASICMNRIRAQLNVTLMKYNAKMILETGIHGFECQNNEIENMYDMMDDL